MLERAQRLAHLVRGARRGELERALRDHRPGVDALIDEVHGHAEDLHAEVERLLDRPQAREGGQQRGVHVDYAARKAGQKRRPQQLHEARKHDQARPAP